MRGISDAAVALLADYRWPGNVRELRNVMERASILCPADGDVLPEHLPPLVSSRPGPPPTTMEESERRLVEQALREHDGNIQAAAKALGVSRGTLYRKIDKYGLDP